jgi:retinol dehydrogenase-13
MACRVIGVTGATGAIGKAIVSRLARDPDCEVICLCRDEVKADRTVENIKKETGNHKVKYELVDLSRETSVQQLRKRWSGPLHVLINNAGITPGKRTETKEGIELQFATNVMGYAWMTLAFADVLKIAAPSRVINVSSFWAGGLDLNDLEFKNRRYDNDVAYRQSKQANRMVSNAFARRFEPFGVTVNACHPGSVTSTLGTNLGFGGFESADQASRTPVWLATHPIGAQETGKYFEYMRESPCAFCREPSAVEALYETCLEYVRYLPKDLQ